MDRKRNLWIIIGIVIFVAALVSGFVLTQASAEEILVQALDSAENITDGHAVVTIEVDSIEKDANGTVEVWARRDEDGDEHSRAAFRVEVLEASDSKAQGAVIVSDGATLWAYSPAENKVFIGTPEEAHLMMDKKDFMGGKFSGGMFGEHFEGMEGNHEDGEHEHPENAEEAVAKLQEYFNIGISGSETVAGETADQLELVPIPEQMPSEYAAVGGIVDLWIGQESNLPLGVAYTGGSLGEFRATVLEFEVNTGLDDTHFTFEVPDGAEVITIADLEPQILTLDEAGLAADFEFLTPGETPTGATLVDIIDVRGVLVQRYTLPEGGSFTIAQGVSAEKSAEGQKPLSKTQSVNVRGTTGQLFLAEEGGKVLLTWSEGDLIYSVAGVLTPEWALTIAESLQ